jgi:hypothetical protein
MCIKMNFKIGTFLYHTSFFLKIRFCTRTFRMMGGIPRFFRCLAARDSVPLTSFSSSSKMWRATTSKSSANWWSLMPPPR